MALNTNIGPERVEVIPTPLGTIQVPGASTSICAFLIASPTGALNAPTAVTNLEDFVTLFGDENSVTLDGYFAVKGYFDNGGTGKTAIIVNVTSGAAEAADFIGDAAMGTGLRALDTIDDIGLICAPGLPLEMSAAVHKALVDYVSITRTDYGATLGTSFGLLSIPKEITKANKDVLVTSYTLPAAQTDATLTFTGGPAGLTNTLVKLNGTIVAYVLTQVGDDLTFNVSVTAAMGDELEFYTPSAVNYKEYIINNPSKSCGWYFNPVVVLDSTGQAVTVDPVGHIAGIIGRIDANRSIGGVSHAPAGIQYAGLAGIQSLALSLSERMDAEPLRLNFINRLQSFPGSGFVIFGGYTADSGTSPTLTADEQLIQVIRAVQFVKSSLEPGLRAFLWENFSPETQSQVKLAIESFLRNNIYLFPAGLPEAQQFRVVTVEATQNDLDQGLLKVRVLIKPNKAVRFIEVTLEYPLPTA